MVSETFVTFPCGGDQLAGVLHESGWHGETGVIIVVGGAQYRVGSHRMFVTMGRKLSGSGLTVLRFDTRGMGDSEGSFPGFASLNQDIEAAVDFLLENRPELRRVVLLGLCDGATAAAMYAPIDSRVSAQVLLNPWVHSEGGEAKAYLWHYYPRRVLQREFWRALGSGGVQVRASLADFFRKAKRALLRSPNRGKREMTFVDRMREAMTEFHGRTLVVASGNDLTAAEFIDLWTTDRRWRKARDSAAFRYMPGADHTLSTKEHLATFCSLVSDWLLSDTGHGVSEAETVCGGTQRHTSE